MPKEKKIESESQSKNNTPVTEKQAAIRRNYKKELQQALAEKNDLKDKLLRTAAEFDNFRKRTNNEKPEWMDQARADLITAILPVLDDLQRFMAADENKDYEVLHAGVEMITKNFQKILGDYGLKEMEAVGQPFDPEKHDALLQMEVQDKEPDIVVEQHIKGYEFKDKVLRHAQVIVSK